MNGKLTFDFASDAQIVSTTQSSTWNGLKISGLDLGYPTA